MATAARATPNPDIIDQALAWQRSGRSCALATVVATYGSAPRPCGSMLLVDADGSFAGSVSGGCIEAAVVAEALEVIASGEPRELGFGVSDEDAWEVGLSCGGEITILLEALGPARAAQLAELESARRERRALACVSNLEAGTTVVVDPADADAAIEPALQAKVAARLAADASGIETIASARYFVAPHNPPLRLAIVGAVHVTQALVPMARLLGLECVVIDPRASWIGAERFSAAEAKLMRAWPQEALAELGLDARTAVATLTHDPKIDDPALVLALASDAPYVGALGSRSTHAKRCERLKAEGLDAAQLERIHAPIGLDINASGAAEIALAILAQIVLSMRRPRG